MTGGTLMALAFILNLVTTLGVLPVGLGVRTSRGDELRQRRGVKATKRLLCCGVGGGRGGGTGGGGRCNDGGDGRGYGEGAWSREFQARHENSRTCYCSFDPSSFSSGFGGAVSASLEDDGFGFSGQPEFLPPPIPTQKSDFTIPPLHQTEAAFPYDRLPALDPLGTGIYDEDIRGGFADPAYGSPFGAPPIPAQSVPPRRAPTNSAAADHSLNATLLRAYHAAQQQKVAAAEDIIPNPLLGDLPAPIPPPAPKKYSPKPAPAALPHPVPSNPLQEATAPAAVPAGGSLADQVIQNATRTDPLAADSSPVVNHTKERKFIDPVRGGFGDGGGNDSDRGGSTDYVRMKRLKNTEAARRSRARKLVKMESLLATAQDLESENTKLVSHLALLENERAAWETKHREYCRKPGCSWPVQMQPVRLQTQSVAFIRGEKLLRLPFKGMEPAVSKRAERKQEK
ncbi:hypothetical protein DFJ73DRAFT_758742 [Zopfochytrium polystomum]|nr:hypothetical protein DFJ73DRAFT_758742 [Zopfochytrium polystomum]